MFPGVDGFHWTVAHVLFLSLFFIVALVIAGTVLSAAFRTARDFRTNRATELCWKSDFADLPLSDRRCRHELAGRVPSRSCDHAFDCRTCSKYSEFAALPSQKAPLTPALNYAEDRLYHRGHTWVQPQPDGTLLIGLDDIAEHLIGNPDAVELPEPGAEIEFNGTAWRMTKCGKEIRVRAPIEGTILETGGPQQSWYLKVRSRMPASDPETLRHLLRGPEVQGWMGAELERLQLQLRAPNTAPALADGGTLVHGIMETMPKADWDTVLADTFLEV